MKFKPIKVYIIQEKWQEYPHCWINKYVYKQYKSALKRYRKLNLYQNKNEWRLVERIMY